MEKVLSTNKNDKYKVYVKQIIKLQSYIRQKYWYMCYIEKINTLIRELYERKTKKFEYEPTIFGDDSKENIKQLEIAFKQRQKQMKEGELAQILIGNWIGWNNLGVGNSSGLDCQKKDNSIIMEIKNKWNTCNSGSAKDVLNKLSNYKKKHPKTRCIWAIVNPKSNCKKLHEKIIYKDVEIEKIQGYELFKLVFSIGKINYSDKIIKIVKNTISNI